jgi:predicted ATP-grasp superfamily ATP-dependent carboligase
MDPSGLPRDGSWLVKPLDSGGGLGIFPLLGGHPLPGWPSYYQERIDGPSFSALLLGHRAGATLLGVTRQWIGRPGSPFAYRGSVGPWPLPLDALRRCQALGQALTESFGLIGLFGVDFILRDDQPMPVEVNPRYTASTELLELALGRAFLADHRAACDPNCSDPDPPAPPSRTPRADLIGKAILFADSPCIIPDMIPLPPGGGDWFDVPHVADLPGPGSRFRPGDPVLTVFATGPTSAVVRVRLESELARWKKILHKA